MNRAIVSKKTLDALIRAKLATVDGCDAIEALPVTFTNGLNGHGCNWTIPGWVGDNTVVESCRAQLEHYLAFLQQQFDIPADEAHAD